MSLLRFNRLIQPVDYGVILPFLAKLPFSIGRFLAQARGGCHALLDYDWRSNALNLRYVRKRVFRVIESFSSHSPVWGVFQRFAWNSIEEWQTCLFRNDEIMKCLAEKCTIDNLDMFIDIKRQKKGLVLVSAHIDSFCMGMVLLGMQGLRVHCVNTSGIDDPRLDPTVHTYYKTKYTDMERLMNGKMPPYQNGMAFFYEKLNQGDIVVLMGDVPGGKSTIWIDFMGKKFRLPLSAWYMACKTGSLLGAYVTIGASDGRYHMISFPPYAADPDDPLGSLIPIYKFLEYWIRKYPERWVTSDLLESY